MRRCNLMRTCHAAALEAAELVRLNDALTALAKADERKSKVIELRFFGGLSVEETAEALGISRETVSRDWRFGRAWLKSEMEGGIAGWIAAPAGCE